jgi:hypothetical protein
MKILVKRTMKNTKLYLAAVVFLLVYQMSSQGWAGAPGDAVAPGKADTSVQGEVSGSEKGEDPETSKIKKPENSVEKEEAGKEIGGGEETGGGAERELDEDAEIHVSPPPAGSPGVTPEEMTPTAIKPSLMHKHQVGLEVGFGWGYRVIKPYGDIWCGERDGGDNEAFCSGASPAFMEIGLSFGVLKSMDLIVDFRYGLQKDEVSQRNPLSLMAGIRLWLNPEDSFKWAVGFQLVMDFTKQDGENQFLYNKPKKDSYDFGGRIYGQIQYDFFRYLGVYVKLSAVVGAVRWLRMEMEGLGGVQVRFP